MTPYRYQLPYPEERNRATVAVRSLLALPHIVVWFAWTSVAQTIAMAQWFVILITGRRNRELWDVQRMAMDYSARVLAYAGLLTDDSPPFLEAPDGAAASGFDFDPDADRLSTALRLLFAIPALMLSVVVGLVGLVASIGSWFSIVITGHHPRGMWELVRSTTEFNLRLQAYTLLMTDAYPHFRDGTDSLGGTAPSTPSRPAASAT